MNSRKGPKNREFRPESPSKHGVAGPTPVEDKPDASQDSDPLILPLLALLFLTVVTQLSSLVYNMTVAAQPTGSPEPDILKAVATSTVLLSLVTIPFAVLGLRLGTPLNLGAPLLTGLLQRRPGSAARLWREAGVAIPLGLGLGLGLLFLRAAIQQHLPASLPEFGHRGVVGGLLASGGAAVAEEVWVRLGVMTVLVWVLARGSRVSPVRPAVAWTANLIAAFAFGLLHLPQLAQYGAASGIGISGTMLGNGVVGLAYGWLYWRHSLLAAMLGHFAVDLVLHVFTAL